MHEPLVDALLAAGGLRTLFQPIVSLDSGGPPRVVALECLTRGPRGTNLESAQVLFDYVRLKREEPRVDRACVATALASASGVARGVALSINVHAATLGRDPGFVRFLAECSAAADRDSTMLIVEIVEYAPGWATTKMLDSIAALRAEGIAIALDDVGLGQSNFRMMLDVRPDYFKIDRHFVSGCHRDPHRLAVVRAVQNLARDFSARVIAEGIEVAAEATALHREGIDLFQGHLFGAARTHAEGPWCSQKLSGEENGPVPPALASAS